MKWKETGNDLQKFWLTFIGMVELLLNTILSVRFGDWHLFMTYVKDIITYTFAYDNINSARYLTAMFSEILTLEDDFLKFMKSLWLVILQYSFETMVCLVELSHIK